MATKKFDFNKPIRGLKGDKVMGPNGSPLLLSDLLANTIGGSTIQEGTLKFFGWAVDLAKTGVVELDSEDKTKLENWIKASPGFSALGVGRLCEVLENPEPKAPRERAPAEMPADVG